MDVDHLGYGNRMCSVVFADIVGYSQKLVSQQVTLKARFSALLAATFEHTAADRWVDGMSTVDTIGAGGTIITMRRRIATIITPSVNAS